MWTCECGKPANRMRILWVWYNRNDLGGRIGKRTTGRCVAFHCHIGCFDCVKMEDERHRVQYFAVNLYGDTKQELEKRILAQVLNQHPRSYVPITDIRKALTSVHKENE